MVGDLVAVNGFGLECGLAGVWLDGEMSSWCVVLFWLVRFALACMAFGPTEGWRGLDVWLM